MLTSEKPLCSFVQLGGYQTQERVGPRPRIRSPTFLLLLERPRLRAPRVKKRYITVRRLQPQASQGEPMSPSRPDHHGRKDSRSCQPHARAATPRGGTPRANQNARRGRPQPKVLLAIALVAALVVVLALAVRGCATDNASGQAKADAQQAMDDQVAPQPMDGVSFCAVGDNLANENALAYADSWSDTTGDLTYDFCPLYNHVRDAISGHDIAFANQETTLGVYQGHGYAGYPSYNTPDSMAQAVSDADFVVVYLHMGTEYTNTPNEQQVEAVQARADAGAGLVLCSHAHVIQSMAWLQRSDGSGSTLVAYGLGDFVSGYHKPDCVLSGMLSCDFVRGEDGIVGIQNVAWHTLIEHAEGDVDTVYLARDYTNDMASANELLAYLDDPGGWIRSKTSEVVGSEFQVDQ